MFKKKFEIPKPRYTPREQSKRISEEKIKPQHLGKKSTAVYQQEFFSLLNVKMAFRDHNWNQKFKVLCEEITKNEPDLLQGLFVKFQNMDPKAR